MGSQKYQNTTIDLQSEKKFQTGIRKIGKTICLANDAVEKGTSHFKGNDFQLTEPPDTEVRPPQMEIYAASNSQPLWYIKIIDGFLPKGTTKFPSQSH